MNNISNSSAPEAQATNDPPGASDPVVSMPGSALPGALGLLKSPLFFAVTATVIVITAVVGFESQKLLLSALAGAALELLAVIIIWQYLLLSSRLENMAHRVADLYRQGESTGAEVQNSRSAHGYTHRLLTELSSDQSRSLQSIEELKKVSGIFYEQLKRLSDETRTGQSELQAFLKSSLFVSTRDALQGVQKSLSAIEADLPQLTDQSEIRKSLAAIEAELPKLTDQSGLRKSLAAIEAELPRLTDQSGLRKSLAAIESELATLSAQESSLKQALDVATALDRLNLEVRRQLAKLRQELEMS